MDKSRLVVEEILREFIFPNMSSASLVDKITSALTQASREGYEDGHQAGFEEGYQKGVEDTKEELIKAWHDLFHDGKKPHLRDFTQLINKLGEASVKDGEVSSSSRCISKQEHEAEMEKLFQRTKEAAAKVAESRQFHSDYQYDIGTCDRIANEIKKLKRS